MFFTSALTAVLSASLAVASVIPSSDLESTPDLKKRVAISVSGERLYALSEVRSPDSNGLGIEARFEFWGGEGGGTLVKVEVLSGLFPKLGDYEGPFGYHIHTNPVGKDRNCTKALAHLDPLNVSESLICDPAFPQYCQEGDLSGKHGKFNGTDSGAISTFDYNDDYLRFYPEDFSILGRSIVIHASNKTRLACGDIISTLDGTADASFNPSYKPSQYVKNYPTVAPVNPPQIITPFVGTVFPGDEVLHNLPFPLPSPALTIKDADNVVLTTESVETWVNGTQVTVELAVEKPSNEKAPF